MTFRRMAGARRRSSLTEVLGRTLHRPQVRAVAGTAGLNILTTLLGGMGGVLLARSLGPVGRGLLVSVMQWPYLAGCMATLGTTVATTYWISRDRPAAADIVRTAVAGVVITGFLVCGIGIAFVPLFTRTAVARNGLIALFLLSPVFMANFVWQACLQATDIRRWNLVRATSPLVYFSANFFLWMFGRLTLTTAVGSYGCGVVLQAWYGRRQAHQVLGRHGRIRRAELRRLYSYGGKVFLSSAPQFVNVRLDLLVLSLMSTISSAQLGNYAVAASLSWLALPVSVAFGSVAFPRIASPESEGYERIERLSILGAAIAALATITCLSVTAPLAVPRLFGPGFGDAVPCLWLLAPGTTCLAVNVVLAELLMGRGKPLYTSACEGVASIVTIALLSALVPTYGIRGAAVASSTAYIVATTLLLRALIVARRSGHHEQPEIAGLEIAP